MLIVNRQRSIRMIDKDVLMYSIRLNLDDFHRFLKQSVFDLYSFDVRLFDETKKKKINDMMIATISVQRSTNVMKQNDA